MNSFAHLIFFLIMILSLTSCAFSGQETRGAIIQENNLSLNPDTESDRVSEAKTSSKLPSVPRLISILKEPDSDVMLNQRVRKAGESWFFGQGFGVTAANVGTVVLFPPYAIYLLGNAGLSMAGLEQVELSKTLPETPQHVVVGTYDALTSVPGRLAAAFLRHEYVELKP